RLLQKERGVTLRTRLEHGLVPVNDVAVRILRTSIERLAPLRLLHDNLALTTRSRTRDADSLLLDVFALRIVRTGNKLPKPSDTLHQLRAINRTLFIERHWRRRSDSSLPNLADVATLGITRTAQEWTKASTLQLHRLPTQLARLRFRSLFARYLRLSRIVRAIRTSRRLSIARRFAVETFQV